MTDPLASSICDYSQWMHERMQHLEAQAPAPQTNSPNRRMGPSDPAALKSYMQGMRLLSRLTEGESIAATGEKITDKYPKPSSMLHSCWQYLVRKYQQQSPESDLVATKNSIIRTLECLDSLSMRNFVAGYHEMIDLLHKLKKYTVKAIDVGLPTYLRTASQFFMLQKADPNNRTRIANEIIAHLKTLQAHVLRLIEEAEAPNKARDIEEAQRFLALLANPSTQHHESYFRTPIPTLLLNQAIKELLKSRFAAELVDRVYKFYRLEHKGVIRLHDLHALTIGCAAHISLQELQQVGDAFYQLRQIPLDGLDPKKCYRAQVLRDVAFLALSGDAQQTTPYGHVRHYLGAIGPIFINNPSCHTSEGMLFCDLDGSYRRLFALHFAKAPFCYVILAAQETQERESIRIILPKQPCSASVDELSQRLQPLLLQQPQARVVEIFMPYEPQNPDSAKLTSLLAALHSIVQLQINAIKIHLAGPEEVLQVTNLAFLDMAKKRPGTSFQVRYFLDPGANFKAGNHAYLGGVMQMAELPQNLDVAMFCRADADHFSSIFTHNLPDSELTLGKEAPHRAGLTAPQKINELFFPHPPTQTGRLASTIAYFWPSKKP